MKFRENLRSYLTLDKVGTCWRCGHEFVREDIGGTEGMPEITCSTCGFIIEVYSRQNKTVAWAFITAVTAFALGITIALTFLR